MTENKTKPENASAAAFIKNVEDPQKRKDCQELMKIMHRITGKPSKMWGSSMVGYGTYHYKYDSGREGDYFVVRFSPRKQNVTIYVMPGFDRYSALMKKLGKYKLGRSCLYVKKLNDINRNILETLLARSVKDMRRIYSCN